MTPISFRRRAILHRVAWCRTECPFTTAVRQTLYNKHATRYTRSSMGCIDLIAILRLAVTALTHANRETFSFIRFATSLPTVSLVRLGKSDRSMSKAATRADRLLVRLTPGRQLDTLAFFRYEPTFSGRSIRKPFQAFRHHNS